MMRMCGVGRRSRGAHWLSRPWSDEGGWTSLRRNAYRHHGKAPNDAGLRIWEIYPVKGPREAGKAYNGLGVDLGGGS